MIRGRALAAPLLLAAALTAPACTKDETAEFCTRLRDEYRMTELRDAIDRDDDDAIREQLQRLEDLANDAPEAVAIDLHIVVDTVVKTVRRVTGVTGPGGETVPPPLSAVNDALASVAKSSQRVADWADEKCGLALTR